MCVFLTGPMLSTCPARLILIYLLRLIIFGEERKLINSSCHYLHLPIISSVLGPKDSPEHLVFEHLKSMYFSQGKGESFTLMQINTEN
jgi:hypothetical protein